MEKLIVITDPVYFDGEAAILNQLFEAGLRKLHLRKPKSRLAEVQKLVTQINPEFRKYISIHYYHSLAETLNLGGKHYSVDDMLTAGLGSSAFSFSCSLHSWELVNSLEGSAMDYCFLSPVYDSISKTGYLANQLLRNVPAFVGHFPVYALGGINPSNCKEILESGFYGIAVLGYLWEDRQNAIERYKILREEIGAYVC